MNTESTYKRNKRTWRYWTSKINNVQIPKPLKDYIYDYLKLSQQEARIFYHFVICNPSDEDRAFKAATFKGITGMALTKERIGDIIESIRTKFQIAFKSYYYDYNTGAYDPYKLQFNIPEEQRAIINAMLESEAELVPLCDTPIFIKPDKQKRGGKKPIIESENNEEEEEFSYLQDIIDYMNSRRVSYALGSLAKANNFNMDGERKIVYKASHFSDRIWSSTDGDLGHPILNDREERQKLFVGTWNIDIKSCQVYLVAQLWNLPEVLQFLLNNDFWQAMSDFTGEHDKLKLKKPIFAMIFGMKTNYLTYKFPIWNKLKEHDIVKKILAARDNELAQLINGKTLITSFGEVMSATNREEAKSILSKYIVSYEQKIMLNTFNTYIQSHKDFVMVAYLHDGAWFKSTKHSEYMTKYVELIKKTMIQEAKLLGFSIKVDSKQVMVR